VDVKRFGFPYGRRRLYGDAFVEALGPARDPDEDLRDGDADVARGIQDGVEEVVLDMARGVLARTGAMRLATAGGLFLNCAVNGRLLRALEAPVHPFPVAGDAGAAWGAAARAHERTTGRPAAPLATLFLGHDLDDAEAAAVLDAPPLAPDALVEEIAERVAAGKVVGVARGRAEFGPRALGTRSLLASPRSHAIRDRVNALKGREAWRPLAPVVKEGDATFFHGLVPCPWMILTFEATRQARERIPGGIHVDGTARVQTTTPDDGTLLAPVIDALARRGEPAALLNTSFNRRGEPIVNTAAEALASARAMRIDAVVLGDRLLDLA
jgi:carbamoyltransferase